VRVDDLVRSLLRRPVGLVVVVLVALAGAAYGWTSASTTYESTASVLIIPPAGSEGTPSSNPLVNLDTNISQLALTVSSQLQADAVRNAVVAAGGDGAYTANTLSSDNSAVAQLTPMVGLVASAPTAEGAQGAVTVLVQQVSVQLTAIQDAAKAPADARASVVTSAPPSAGYSAGSAKLRAAGVLGLAAGFAALLALVALQPLLRGGSSRPRPGVSALQPLLRGASRSRSGVPKEAIRALLQDEWERSGRNTPLTRAEAREAWHRAEARLEAGNAPRSLETSSGRRGRRA
jgi:hypothetical protein